ncbi:MAG: tail fiber protein [Paracoccaceae bacterium]|jgi:microcystin-dependent protein|nr:tail fiber protein [Paracoccaceae bacterium]
MLTRIKALSAAAATTLALGLSAAPSLAQEAYIGEVRIFAGVFCPRSWAPAEGQLLAISGNEALFSLLGTTYGGDGRTNFALPDLRGRGPMGIGSGPGLTPRRQGEKGGAETVTLTEGQLPAHSHSLNALSSGGDNPSPTGNLLANDGTDRIYGAGTADTTLSAEAVGSTGSAEPVSVIQPYLAVRYCVALQGLYPSRN